MNDALLVRGVEGIGNLRRNTDGVGGRQRPARHQLRQRRPLDQLEDERARALSLFETVDGRNMRMFQGGKRLRFPLEAGKPLGITGEGVGKYLEGNLAVQPGVAGAIHLAHSARAKRRDDLVRPDPGTDTYGHE